MTTKQIWLIGGKNSNADKAFLWTEDIPDVTDADTVIIDLRTFPPEPTRDHPLPFMPSYGQDPSPWWIEDRIFGWKRNIMNNLHDKIYSGGHVIFLLHFNPVSEYLCNQGLIPCRVNITKTPSRAMLPNNKHQFAKYLECVNHTNVKILFLPTIVIDDPESIQPLYGEAYKITDNSERALGASFVITRENDTKGHLTLLPPYQPSKTEQALDAIISVFKDSVDESPPQWIDAIQFPGLEYIENEINALNVQINNIEDKISRLQADKIDLLKYRRLLYSAGTPLEQAVKLAFTTLGFNEINKIRDDGKEDWIIKPRFIPNVDCGILEVKGRTAVAALSDIRQCDSWVQDYLCMDSPISTKGIFVVNQFRKNTFPDSKELRKSFAPNQMEFVQSRKICIIPTYVLFEAVKTVLEGHKPNRAKIEQAIFTTSGVLDFLRID